MAGVKVTRRPDYVAVSGSALTALISMIQSLFPGVPINDAKMLHFRRSDDGPVARLEYEDELTLTEAAALASSGESFSVDEFLPD